MLKPKKYKIEAGILIIGCFQFIRLYYNKYDENGVVELNNSLAWKSYIEFNCSLADKFNMTLLEFQNILKKYGAEDYYISSLYPHELCFKTIDECVNFATSDEMLPYIMMMKLN